MVTRFRTAAAALPALLFAAAAAAPGSADARAQLREARQVVDAVCASCHLTGLENAPRIGDREAWTPRLARGLDALVDAAVLGHGQMPSRGGMPQLEREELRSAIVYMFNHGLPPVAPPPEAPIAADPRHKLVEGTDIYLGVLPARAVRNGMAKASVPSGKDYYHLNISLVDHRTKAQVTDAQVTLRVSDGMMVQQKKLHSMAANSTVSYGEFFRVSSGSAYTLRTEVRRPGVAGTIVANFDFRAP